MEVNIQRLETVYVDHLPLKRDMEEEKVYITNNRTQATHLCPCGCGTEILTPFGRGGYRLLENKDNSLTLSPQIEHSPCSNSYKVYKNYIVWED